MKDDERIYGLDYSFAPQFEEKIISQLDKLGLTWLHEGWIDGEKEGTISGPKKALLKFQGATPEMLFPLEP